MKKLHKLMNVIKSLRFRITFVIIVAGVLPVTLLTMFALSQYKAALIEDRLEELQNASVLMKNDILAVAYLEQASSDAVDSQIALLESTYNGRIMIINKDFVVEYDTYDVDTGKTALGTNITQCFKGTNSAGLNEEDRSIEIAIALIGTNDSGGVLYFDFSISDIDTMISDLQEDISVILLVVVIIVIAVGFAISFYATVPYKKMQEHIRQLDAGKREENWKSGIDELDKVNESVEAIILRLKKVDESREEFVSNVSHELKTPITSMKVLADSLLAMGDVPAEMYKEFMEDIASEIERETSIINDLLALVRMNKSSLELQISEVNIVEQIEIVIKRVTPIAAKRNIDISFENFKPVTAEVDQVKMSMVITNLIENAVKYNVQDGWVKVSLNADLSYFYLKVSDSGIGIPEDAQMQVFDRFYRVDKARSRETGGTGLGLAITNTVVNMHNGEIKLYSREGEGSTFTVRIPLHYMP
ncbi:MAG: two-component sensor histidine kinase [Lachnospiraceae bacterium]|nr:two-component sensor histidine kinase [Lachnospiraceae bacterium]